MRIVLLFLVIFQIFLLVNMITANSYMIHQNDKLSGHPKMIDKGKNKFNNLIDSGINLLIGFLSIKQIGIASAQDSDDIELWCCPELKNGAICNNILSTEIENCKVTPIETSCENTADCKKGCCFDPEEGLCSTGSPKEECESDGGEWADDSDCLLDKCRKGCCVLGNSVKFTTETNCEFLSSLQGLDKDFRQIWNELSCQALSAGQFEGACISQQGNCIFTTKEDCFGNRGGKNFYKNYLCSHPSLETNCERQDHVDCVSNKYEIYWIDSCGNRENIYFSNRGVSWNNGMVLKKENSCSPNSANIGSTTCGNCAPSLSKCSEVSLSETHVQDGNFVCKDLGCENAPANVGTQDRLNGEKWCLYDGYIGDGKDTVGSENWLMHCHEGKAELEKRCGEQRGSLCQQQVIEWEGRSFSIASCFNNDEANCYKISQDYWKKIDEDIDEEEMEEVMEEMGKECNENQHCMIKSVDVEDTFKFDMCVPRYSKGADLRDEGADDNMCWMADKKCTVYYWKNFWGVWECSGSHNDCECETDEFAEKMNDLCISVGDCGSYINYVGEGSDNIEIKGRKGKKLDGEGKEIDEESECKGLLVDDKIGGDKCGEKVTPEISWKDYINYKNPVANQHVEPKNIDEFLSSILGDYSGDYETANWTAHLWLAGISGGLGVLAVGVSWLSNLWLGTTGIWTLPGTTGAGVVIGGIATVFTATAIGTVVGLLLATAFGLHREGAIAMVIAGTATGAGIGILILAGLNTGWSVPGWILLGFGILAGIWSAATGWGQMETRRVEFKCLPWQAPTFSSFEKSQSNCAKCNEDSLRPCTKYRCDSLGQTCRILNEDQENPPCESIEYETNPPVISPSEMLSKGYIFQNKETKKVEIRKSNGECIQEFTPVLFKLKTDESAKCKYSFEKPINPNYEEMEGELPVERNAFTINHTFGFNIPSIDSLSVYNITEEVIDNIIEMYGNINMYVKCQDSWENFNIDEYVVNFCVHSGPDETAVNHAQTITEPENEATLKYGINKTKVKIWINEPAECSYDILEGKGYKNMEFPMECKTGLGDADLNGWPCSENSINLDKTENIFYIKCEDASGNINQDDFVYTLYVSESELKIDSVTFNYGGQTISSGGTFAEGFEPISIEMKVKTSGGAKDGKAECYWGVLEDGSRWRFYDTFSNIHTQILTPRFRGTHTNYITCQDEAENIVNSVAEFTINVDSDAPKVVRAYQEGGSLKLITNENAKCYYDLKRCNFNLEDGNSMTTAFSTMHTVIWNPSLTYYVKCKDLFENINIDCAIKIIPSS